MKFDDKHSSIFSEQSKLEKAPDKAVDSKVALNEYYSDMLGSLADDPLRELEEAENQALTKRQSPGLPSAKNQTNISNEYFLVDDLNTGINPLNELARQKIKPKLHKETYLRAEFAEPKIKTTSSLVIPAAFPKLAPASKVKTKAIVSAKPKVRTEQKSRTETKTSSKVVLDSKTALALLELKKSKMTEQQKLRLEKKLKLKLKLYMNGKKLMN